MGMRGMTYQLAVTMMIKPKLDSIQNNTLPEHLQHIVNCDFGGLLRKSEHIHREEDKLGGIIRVEYTV